MKKVIECVPNFSEGRDLSVIKQITDAIESVQGIELLDVDPGESTNRTVVTFIGEPEPVKEAAFRAVKTSAGLIDMSKHQGEHSRFGATDVLPFVPVSGATMEECADIAREVGRRIGEELGIPVYLYEHAASTPERRNLATVRSGEYEGLAKKLANTNSETKVAFGTEAGFFDALGIPTIVCGPGSMEGQGHKPDEFITRDQLAACDAMMDRILVEISKSV